MEMKCCIDRNNRITIPAILLDEIDLKDGDLLNIEIENDIVILSRK